jgi:hypothetical protein
MTPNEAKKIIKAELERLLLPFTTLTARTVGFSDLGRGSRIFVTIHGWHPNPAMQNLKDIGKVNGFSVEADGPLG